jgi:hypothetical protein
MSDLSQVECVKKKRGRKKKSDIPNIQITIEEIDTEVVKPLLKKRGRKPKGGKLTLKTNESINKFNDVVNVILHLKCSLNDLNDHNMKINKMVSNPLEYNPSIPPNILTYNDTTDISHFGVYNSISKGNDLQNISINNYAYNDNNSMNSNICSLCKNINNNSSNNNTNNNHNTTNNNINNNNADTENDDDVHIKDINTKLKKLKICLYKNTLQDKKSACFWCTYEYDNPPCYIPKYELDGKIYGYGSFCRPECAVAYLMKETIDDSSKFERYHLLNQLYSKVYNYKKNIKPAANPYYLLDRYYGNLTIQEYRKLLKTEHMLSVIDKPMTRILPELHEDYEDTITNIYGNNGTKQSTTGNMNNTGVYKVKRQSESVAPSKSSIIKDTFGIS